MRSIPRKTIVAGLASVIALVAAGNAFATGAADNRFDLAGAVSLNSQDTADLGKANLFLQVTMLDNDNTPPTPAENFEEARIDMDDDIVLNNKKFAKCTADPTVLAADTTQQAVDDCGVKSQIGSGNAKVRFAGFAGLDATGNQEVDFTVTTFNGPTSTAGPAECTATSAGGPSNCEWSGDDPSIYLHARNEVTGQTTLARGEIQDAADTLAGTGTPPITAGYNQRLLVSDASDVAGDAGAISMFNSVIGGQVKYKQNGKNKTVNYISARCNPTDDADPFAAGVQPGFKFKGEFVYDDDTTHGGGGASIDTDSNYQYCAAK